MAAAPARSELCHTPHSAELMHTHTPTNAQWQKKNNIATLTHILKSLALSQANHKNKTLSTLGFYIPRGHLSRWRVIQ